MTGALDTPIFDIAFQAMQAQRSAGLSLPPHPLMSEARSRLDERLADVKRPLARRTEWPLAFLSPLPVQESFDLVTSTLSLQRANDIAGELHAIYTALAQEGLFAGVVIGGQSLHELRYTLTEAETSLRGGASPRVVPAPDAESLSRILPRVGFALPVIDTERVTLDYPCLQDLMQDLRRYGCSNALTARPRAFTRRALFEKAQDIYAQTFASPSGGIAVTVDLVFLHGWKAA